MFKISLLTVFIISLFGCNDNYVLNTPQSSFREISYVENPSPDGTTCMYDRPSILYWSDSGITATVLAADGRWVYHTYSWDEIGISPLDSILSYEIQASRIIFPGTFRAILQSLQN